MYKSLINICRWTVAAAGMFVIGIISLAIITLSFGSLRNFFVKYVFRPGSRMLLRLFGYTFELPPLSSFPVKQVVYTINHNSYLDVFLLAAIGLSNTWYVLSEVTIKYFFLVITSKAAGTHYIPQKKHPERRLKFFLRTTEFLKKRKKSLIVSAEGVRGYIHGIQPFNKGIFHMAMEAGLPVVPIYIHIPKESNIYKGSYAKPGHLQIELLDEIATSGWELESIWEEIAVIRKMYVDKFNALNGTDMK